MGWQQREQGGMNGSTASVASSGSASKKPQRASPTNPPGHQPSQRILILQKILREHQQWLNTPSPPSDDFGDPSLKWYWDSADKRSQNLEYIYRAIINYCVQRVGIEDKRIIVVLVKMCEGPLKDPELVNVKWGLPNWFITAILLWMALWNSQGGNGGNRDIFSPFVAQQCKSQVLTFLRILEYQLQAEEYLVFKIDQKPTRVWISRSGLPPLPRSCIIHMVKNVKRIFESDAEIQRIAGEAERAITTRIQE